LFVIINIRSDFFQASSSPDAAFNAGIWFFKHGQYEKAKKFFSECLKMSAEKGLFNLLFKTCQQLCQTLLKLKDLESCLRTAQVGEKQGTIIIYNTIYIILN
jgi:outer membrane translocation and assembly module TamA